jgi:hypothetical protein
LVSTTLFHVSFVNPDGHVEAVFVRAPSGDDAARVGLDFLRGDAGEYYADEIDSGIIVVAVPPANGPRGVVRMEDEGLKGSVVFEASDL